MTRVRVVGRGRAGGSFELALRRSGLEVELLPGRSETGTLARVAHGCDAVLLAVPDGAVGGVASSIEPDPSAVMLHCSGSLGLDVLERGAGGEHLRRGSLHPLATLPDPVVGSMRLAGGTSYAVSGDGLATEIVLALGGRPLAVPDERRAEYHAAACIASNHVVALLGQVERIAASCGLPVDAFLSLARGAVDDVSLLGPAAALTGPAARGDVETIEAHRRVLAESELAGYEAGAALAARLAEVSRTKGPAPPEPSESRAVADALPAV